MLNAQAHNSEVHTTLLHARVRETSIAQILQLNFDCAIFGPIRCCCGSVTMRRNQKKQAKAPAKVVIEAEFDGDEGDDVSDPLRAGGCLSRCARIALQCAWRECRS